MNRHEAKTGQSVDIQKFSLINPVVLGKILDIPGLPTNFSLIDFGSGDASSTEVLIHYLASQGYSIKSLGLVDADVDIFPDLLETSLEKPISSMDTTILQTHSQSVVKEFLKHSEEKYDLGISQLVLHQISNDHEASYLMYLAYRTLKPEGNLLIVNLHPKYLKYLAENEKDKFTVTNAMGDRVVGRYNFDSSGSAPVYSRNMETQLSTFLGLGFDLVDVTSITTDSIADQKKRYGDLAQKNIPMFYLMQLKKNPENFISSTDGTVKKIASYDQKQIVVTFADDEEIRIPSFKDWEKVKSGDILSLLEIRRKEVDARLLSYWVINSKEEITGGQLVYKEMN